MANRAAYAVTTIAEWGIAPLDSALAEDVAQTLSRHDPQRAIGSAWSGRDAMATRFLTG